MTGTEGGMKGIFNPTILLSDYITYEEIDYNHVQVFINYNGKSGTGIYTIEDNGQISKYESNMRQKEIIDGEISYLGWRTEGENYEEVNGIKLGHIQSMLRL